MPKVWKIAPGVGAEDWDTFRKSGCICLGWLADSDYRRYRSEEEIVRALAREYRNSKRRPGAGTAQTIWRFVHDVQPHDIVVANQGYNGVVGIGVITSEYLSPKSRQNPLREDTTSHRHHARRVDWLVTEPVVLPGKQFFVQATLWPLKSEQIFTIRQKYEAKFPRLKRTVDRLLGSNQARIDALLPEEILDASTLFEGAVRKIVVNAYERNPVARKKCIAKHGTTCCICGFNFATAYGPEAEGYIHVHHLRALSEINEEYVVDPIEDLRPICPNCHAVVHLGGKCRAIDEVKKMLKL